MHSSPRKCQSPVLFSNLCSTLRQLARPPAAWLNPPWSRLRPRCRKAARERDRGRCRFPGCESRKVDLHHIQYWSNGGRTCLENLISLCRRHHTAVHDRGYLIAASPDGSFAFFQPGGTPLPLSPSLPAPGGTIAGVHDAEITPGTIIPPWFGERLDLDYAIYTCLANERVYAGRAVGRAPGASIPPCDCRPGEPADPIAYFREYYAKHPEERRDPAGAAGRRRGPVSVKVVSTG
jgi:5-methylcytosine-specific restriction endonuclease McrA